MFMMKLHILIRRALVLPAVALLFACSPVDLGFTDMPSPGRTEDTHTRTQSSYRNVFLVYSMGFNDLTTDLAEDIRDLIKKPALTDKRDVLLILSHSAKSYPREYWPRFDELQEPTLTRISLDPEGNVVKDTLMVMPKTTVIADTDVLRDILEYTKEAFDAERYGILLSSHGTGWAPSGYLNNPDRFDPPAEDDDDDDDFIISYMSGRRERPVYNMGRPGEIPVKSMGVHFVTTTTTIEMDIQDLAKAFPFKMDYIIFDACFMGGVEVAYELRDVTDWLIASQTEIRGEGMEYETMTSYLFAPGGPDLEGFCKRYFEYYDAMSGTFRSATISLLDCSKLETLADVSKDMFNKYRDGLNALQKTRNVQQYYRNNSNAKNHKLFYDFTDIIEKTGISDEDRAEFDRIMDEVVIYKAATPNFFSNELKIERHSGLSMYLPYDEGKDYLNNFYKSLEWNKAVKLIP